MRFGLFLPPQANAGRVPALWWLSGLTCTEENFIVKAGAQRVAAELGLALVVPDTSPRGITLPGDRDTWDFGVGAGFYVDATCEPWSQHYRMRQYISEELRGLVEAEFPVDGVRTAMSGHSMGGHGALTMALSMPGWIRSVSAFAPIAAPMRCPWGEKALAGYLGQDRAAWAAYDSTALVQSRGWSGPPILVDQGEADPFLVTQLRPELLEQACAAAKVPLQLRRQPGYDHGYHFVSTFIEDHLRHHRAYL
jgi:S-formylglutathione hydrolase